MMHPSEFANLARCEKDFWWHRGMEQILFRVLDPIVKKRKLTTAIETGCGTGHMASRLEQRYGWRVFPTDLQHEGLVYGLRNGCRRGAAQADIVALPFANRQFDVVTSLDVITHFPAGDEHRAIGELVRVLAPGGLLIVRVCALDILRSRHSMFTDERQRFTRQRLIEAVSRQGIRVLRCTYLNSLLLPVAFTKFRLIEPLFRVRPASGIRQMAGWLNELLYSALRLESSWLGSGHSFPLGQSLLLIGEPLTAGQPAVHGGTDTQCIAAGESGTLVSGERNP